MIILSTAMGYPRNGEYMRGRRGFTGFSARTNAKCQVGPSSLGMAGIFPAPSAAGLLSLVQLALSGESGYGFEPCPSTIPRRLMIMLPTNINILGETYKK
jgi:hypothetical protein